MDITEVRIKLVGSDQENRLLGFCSMTIDDAFVVRDLKIIRGNQGPFVAMPSRKLTDRCESCGFKNQLRAAFCNQCGKRLNDDRSQKQSDGKAKLYADIAHPINSACRDLIQSHVIEAFEQELIDSQQPDYTCRYDDFGEYDDDFETSQEATSSSGRKYRTDEPQSEREVHRTRDTQANATANQSQEEFGSGVF